MNEFTQTVELANGSQIAGTAYATEDERCLWVWLQDSTMREAYTLFSDPENTAVITSHTTQKFNPVFTGYTELTLIKVTGTRVDIRLEKTSTTNT